MSATFGVGRYSSITPFSSRGEALGFPRALNAGERIAVHMVVTHHPKGLY